jgi:hypothetical protein
MVDFGAIFPGLRSTSHQITSPPVDTYNCIAWAAGDVARWWWPDALKQRYWPATATRAETVAAFQEAFATLGYSVCTSEDAETGHEKIAVFADHLGPQHVARQLPGGTWTSKLGELEDIEHSLRALEGVEYGQVALLMKRPIQS